MDEYIRRGQAIEETCSDCTERNICGGSCSDTDRLRAIPAADMVAVVRCADCKYDERCMFQSFVRDERVEPYDKTVFFCADGKRKDGGQDDGD